PEKTVSTDVSGAVLSPDGRRMVATAVTNGINRLWLYSFDSPTPELLPGTEGGHLPFWSPNGQSIGFFDGRNLKRIELSGGIVTTLCLAPVGTGGAWNRTGDILSVGRRFDAAADGGAELDEVAEKVTWRLFDGQTLARITSVSNVRPSSRQDASRQT